MEYQPPVYLQYLEWDVSKQQHYCHQKHRQINNHAQKRRRRDKDNIANKTVASHQHLIYIYIYIERDRQINNHWKRTSVKNQVYILYYQGKFTYLHWHIPSST